jgi:hypothetical protein
MGILFNVLDRRTYAQAGVNPYRDILWNQKYDYNEISEEDHRKYVYARGLSLELIHWLDSRFIVADVEGNANPEERLKILDLHAQYIS